MVSSDLAILNRVFRSQAIFPLNWVLEKFDVSLKHAHVRSQARVGVLYLERSDYYLVERHYLSEYPGTFLKRLKGEQSDSGFSNFSLLIAVSFRVEYSFTV